MSTLIFDIALNKRFTINTSELDLADVDDTDVLLIYNQQDSTVYQIPMSTIAEFVNSSQAVTSVAGKTGAVTLVKADVGLSNVDNTSDLNKPISTATQTALNAKASQETGTWTPSTAGLVGFTQGASPSKSGTRTKLQNRAFVDFVIDFDSSDAIAVGNRFTISNLPYSAAESFIMSAGTAMAYSSWGSGVNAYFHVGVAGGTAYIECIHVSGAPTYQAVIKGQLQYRV